MTALALAGLGAVLQAFVALCSSGSLLTRTGALLVALGVSIVFGAGCLLAAEHSPWVMALPGAVAGGGLIHLQNTLSGAKVPGRPLLVCVVGQVMTVAVAVGVLW
jgi:hypothetical protein